MYSDVFAKTLLTASEDDWFAELWIGTGLEEAGGVLEIDYTLGKVLKLGEPVTLTVKVDFYDIGGPSNIGFDDISGDVLHPALQAIYSLNGDSTVYLFGEVAYFSIIDDSINDGSYTDVGVGYRHQQNNFGITLKGRVGYNKSFQADESFVRVDIATSYALNKTITLFGPGLKYIDAAGSGSAESYNLIGLMTKW